MPHETSSAQRAIDWAKIIETALTAPGNVGNTYNRFYDYSFLNQIYLRMQGVHEPAATWARWQRLGRHVLRGAKAKEIIRPVIIHKKNKADETVETVETVVGFKSVKCCNPQESSRQDCGVKSSIEQ
jgi:N-terminal domain of anti-restriction factor ArdC